LIKEMCAAAAAAVVYESGSSKLENYRYGYD
jgi:hypothetical protein